MGDAFIRVIVGFVCNFQASDIINLLGIVVNALLACWIVNNIQKNLTNQRVLKDHFITELKDLRASYLEFVRKVLDNEIIPKEALSRFKLLEIRRLVLFKNLKDIYKIESPELARFSLEFRELVTNSPEFVLNFRSNTRVTFTTTTHSRMMRLQRQYDGTIDKIIIKVNNS